MHRVSGNGTPPAEGHTDPNYATTVEVFDNLTHVDIQRGVQALDPEVLTAGRQAWQQSAAGLAEAVQSAHTEIRGAIADGWRGGAAQLAADAVTAFERLGQNLSDVMAVVGRRLGQANDAAETLRASVSQQMADVPNLEAALLDPKQATANSALQKSAENLRLDAVRVMDSVYAGVFLPTGDNVPAFPEGGMYPNPAVAPPGPDETTAPGGGSADLVGTPTPRVAAEAGELPGGPQAPAADPDRPGDDRPGEQPVERPAAVAPAAATVPSGVEPATRVTAPAVPGTVQPAVAPVSGPGPAMVVDPVAPQRKPPAKSMPVPAAPAGVPSVATVTTATSGATTPANAQNSDPAKRDERDDRNSGTDAVSGMGAGIVGGLAGGAFAAGDAVRQGTSGPAPVRPPRLDDDEDDDEDYFAEFDEPTFLEPAEPGGELVGQLGPTTPPVLGEWSEDD
ncbi:WXG100 family type VII secretion target [Nocardia spumae]|uniref:WXG100 family type VII secretion target n=1 Tax=Nocardia spumae TaxID=2887190 RepID=UPI001D156DC5|nr:hypothetical protein [Nocardia spumae]